MVNSGWKTVIISEKATLSYKQGLMVIEKDGESEKIVKTVPLTEMKLLVIESLMVKVSIYLLNELRKEKIKVFFTDQCHNPAAEMVAYHDHHKQSMGIYKQLSWTKETTDFMWLNIVKQKILLQKSHLERVGMGYQVMDSYLADIEPGDITNREALAAKSYFARLFGKKFSRKKVCDINAYLNYGYAILLAMVNRQVTISGYITNLGIHHHSEENPFNLSCDLMEPFRPFVDEIVYQIKDKPFGKEGKMELINSFYREIKFVGK